MSVIYLSMYITLTSVKFYFIIKSFFSIRFFQNISTPSASCVGCWLDIVCGFLQYWHVKCNLPLTYIYSACLLTAKMCSLISLYIVNHKECFKKIITTIIFSRKHQLRKRLLPYFMLMQRGFVRRNFIGHHRWNGRESTNQLRQHISHANSCISCFIGYSYTISPDYYLVLVILNISPAYLPFGMVFLCFSRPPGCPRWAKDHVYCVLSWMAASYCITKEHDTMYWAGMCASHFYCYNSAVFVWEELIFVWRI